MIQSMTGFASAQGKFGDFSWTAEIRSVNNRGLDIKLRLPDWIDGLEAASRDILKKNASRGSVSMNFKLLQDSKSSKEMRLDLSTLEQTLDALIIIENSALKRGINLEPSKASDLLQSSFGVTEDELMPDDMSSLRSQIISALEKLVSDFCATRRAEGAELEKILTKQLTDLERLFQAAIDLLPAREKHQADNLKSHLNKILKDVGQADPQRVAQELAVLAIRSDVMEEIDRLKVHMLSAREMLSNGGIIGRKMDFLMQEFNREANTLCSKSQNSDLTAIGLEIKVLIDQMREQVQNLE
ncbi:MAG: YicC family protein [Aestuariivita sp.]|nr:YicC family protein [Aestuariivita sp.]